LRIGFIPQWIRKGFNLDKFWAYLPLILTCGILFILLTVLNVIRRRIRLRSLRPSFKLGLLRIPGGSLLMRLDNLNEQINVYLVYVIILPLIIYSALISYSYFQAEQPSLTVIWISSIICVLIIAYMAYNLVKFLSRRNRTRLAYEGQLAVGQELNQLMLHGYRVYHDFPANTFNIDHIIVGPTGVFAVETRTRSKGAIPNGSQEATVTYDGRMLTFADTTDFETIEQAEQQADWLSQWLGAATGEPIAVRAIVTLPGWVVKRTSADGIPVVNPGQFTSLFEHIKPRPLSETMLDRIKDKIELKCRNH
jgi:hypothetical protein